MFDTHRVPVNAQASSATRPFGESGKFAIRTRKLNPFNSNGVIFRDVIKGILSTQPHLRPKTPADIVNYAEEQFGRLTVIAYSHKRKSRRNGTIHYWIVRCSCGEYEMRSQKTLKRYSLKESNDDIMCATCFYTSHLERRFAHL